MAIAGCGANMDCPPLFQYNRRQVIAPPGESSFMPWHLGPEGYGGRNSWGAKKNESGDESG